MAKDTPAVGSEVPAAQVQDAHLSVGVAITNDESETVAKLPKAKIGVDDMHYEPITTVKRTNHKELTVLENDVDLIQKCINRIELGGWIDLPALLFGAALTLAIEELPKLKIQDGSVSLTAAFFCLMASVVLHKILELPCLKNTFLAVPKKGENEVQLGLAKETLDRILSADDSRDKKDGGE